MNNLTPPMLPPRAKELAQLIGLANLRTLVAWRGGVYLYIPVKLLPQHPIVQKIGHSAAQKLIDHHAGERIEIPSCATTLRAAMHDEIREKRKTQTEAALAREYGLWSRSIRRICAQTPQQPQHKKQRDLWSQ